VTKGPAVLLASSSPRRRHLLGLGRWNFTVAAPEVDETPRPNEPPREYVLRLAEWKARAAARFATSEGIVLAADTTVVDGGEIRGKPADRDDARSVLRRLRARTHHVFTGIAALRLADQLLLTDVCQTAVPMRNYSDIEIDRYVESGDPLDKAGSYAIHHPVFKPVDGLAGCYASVMGLPICHVMRILRQLDAPAAPTRPHGAWQTWPMTARSRRRCCGASRSASVSRIDRQEAGT
jgi:MAF protein